MKIHSIAAAAIVCTAVASFASPVSDFIKSADHLRIGDAKSADNSAFEIGHLKLTFASGAIAPVFAGSDAVGFFFKGKGSLTYETTETAELPVVAHNVRAIAHVKITADATHGVITDDFDTLLVVAG